MRKRLFAVCLILFALSVLAQTNLPPIPELTNSLVIKTNVPVHALPVVQQSQDQLSQYLTMIIPLVVPLLITGLKKFLPNVPGWALPILAPGLGALADWILQLSGVQTGGTIKGMLLGSAGVGLRELVDQVKQFKPPTPPTAPPAPVAPNVPKP